jgi:predicted RNase H-like nuclease
MIAGVDGCKDKWIAAIDRGDGRTQVVKPRPLSEVIEDPEIHVLVIDIPIGLTEVGPRTTDVQARQFLGKRGVCVFPAPIRPILASKTWEEACQARLRIENKGVSKQAFGIFGKVSEVDVAVRSGAPTRIIREGHPEVSFAIMNGASPVSASKRTLEGRKIRQELIYKQFPDAKERINDYPYHRVDILDAYALLWTARRIQRGEERRFPTTPECDKFGLRMEIVA